MKVKWPSVLVAVVLLLVVGVVLSLVIWPKKKERTVRIAYPKIVALLPHLVAKKQGFYKNHRLKVEETPVPSSAAMIDAIRLDRADFLPAVSLADTVNAAIAEESQPPLQIISHSRMKKDVPFECLLVTSGSPLASLKELENRIVGVFPGSTSEAAIKWYLKREGIPVDKIKFIPVPPTQQIDALLLGKVDAVHAYEPQRTLGIKLYGCKQVSPSIYAALSDPLPSSIGCTAISTKVLREDPELARDIIAAWDDAVQYIRDHDKEARELLATDLGIPADIAQQCTWVDVTKSSELNVVAMNKFIEILQTVEPRQIREGNQPAELFYAKP
jgi:ABC-type nitrate/sulfonate/bicarbonate transport system substrate-binding protein